jgi:hypothetical protein
MAESMVDMVEDKGGWMVSTQLVDLNYPDQAFSVMAECTVCIDYFMSTGGVDPDHELCSG